jgi:hypothetical protein
MNGAALPLGSKLFHAPSSKAVSSVHGSSYCCWGSISAGGAVHYDETIVRFEQFRLRRFETRKSSCRTGANGARKTTTMDVIATCVRHDRIAANNLTLSFMGDSMTRQTLAVSKSFGIR